MSVAADALRVLMVSDVSPAYPAGGGERMLWEQARHLAARGHAVRLLSRGDAAAATAPVERERVRIRHFPVERASIAGFIKGSILGARRALATELAVEPADVLHVHQPLAGYGALTSRAGARLPSLYSFYSPAPLEYRSRGGMTPRHRAGLVGATGTALLWAIERACLRRARLVHVLSDFSADQLWKLYAVPRERIVRIRGAAATEHFRPAADRAAVRRSLGISPGRPLLLTVRNLEARMGLDNLLDAMALVTRRQPDVLLLIGGAGSLRRALETQVRVLGLEDHVRFLGFVSDDALPAYYQAADVFVLPTRELEGFGLVTVEALACGTPVLGTPVGATPEILQELGASLVLRGGTPELMAHDLDDFLAAKERDPDAYARLRDACREHVERHYTWARATTELERALESVATAAPAGVVASRPRAPASPRPASPAAPSGSAAASGCPACGAPTRPSGLLYRGVRHRRCGRCGSSLAAELPTAPELEHRYREEYPRSFAPERLTAERGRLFAGLLDQLEAHGLRRREVPRLLDIGGGGGHLAALARGRRWFAASADLAHQGCMVARANGVTATVQADGASLPFADGTIDAVTLVNVVDQAHAPLTILREAHRVLAGGGLIVLRVPNARFHRPWVRLLVALGPLVRSRGWDAYPAVHHFAFTPTGLARLVARAGFTVIHIRNSVAAPREPVARPRAIRTLPRWGRTALVTAAAALAALSRDRCLVGPSLDLFARKGAP
jgi:glycosyltransferase involved in cell wall biosynthesis/SAM-dependent methyltransferase